MKLLAIGCLHGRIPKGFRRYIKRKKIDALLILGDLPDWRVRPYWIKLMDNKEKNPKNWEDVSLEGFVGRRKFRKMEKHDLQSMQNVLKEINSLGLPAKYSWRTSRK